MVSLAAFLYFYDVIFDRCFFFSHLDWKQYKNDHSKADQKQPK